MKLIKKTLTDLRIPPAKTFDYEKGRLRKLFKEDAG